jgi:hypothetical protein
MEVTQNFIDEWLRFSRLLHDEVTLALLRDLDKGIASHVLDTYHQMQSASCAARQYHDRNLPSCVSCMNSNNLLTTVFRNFQCALRNLGYCPTMYMMSEAQTALLSLPRFISVNPSRSLITVTRNRFSTSSPKDLY